MQLRGSKQSYAAALCLAGASLLGNGYALYVVTRQPADMPVRVYEARFDEVRPHLPTRGVVGYVSDLQDGADTKRAGLYFYLTQYFLAPLILEEGANQPYVIGDYQAQVPPVGGYVEQGLRSRVVGENGVVLYTRDAP